MVGYTRDDIDTFGTVTTRSIRAADGRPGHNLDSAYGYGLFTGGMVRTMAPRSWAARAQLVAMITSTIGVSTEVVVQEPETIKRSLSKMRRIADRRLR